MGLLPFHVSILSLKSRKQGTYLGTLSDVNHLDLVGWINTARYKWAEIMGKEIKFRPATFYLGIVDMLAAEVENVQHDSREEGEVEVAFKQAREAEGEPVDHKQPGKRVETS